MSASRPGAVDVNVNDVVAFFVELGVLALLAVGGWQLDAPRWSRFVLAAGLPAMAAVLWGPFARRRVS